MNWGVKVLQTLALPLGYGAILSTSSIDGLNNIIKCKMKSTERCQKTKIQPILLTASHVELDAKDRVQMKLAIRIDIYVLTIEVAELKISRI